MAVTNNDVRATLKSYLDTYPENEPKLKPLLDLPANAIDVTTGHEVRGHITANAVAGVTNSVHSEAP